MGPERMPAASRQAAMLSNVRASDSPQNNTQS